jgi:hypothetical protein
MPKGVCYSCPLGDTVGMWLCPALQYCTMFKSRSCLGYVGRLGWATREHSLLSQTKPGGSIPRHMAQFATIKCLEMLDSCPQLFYTCSLSRCLIHFFICIDQTIAIVCTHLISLHILQVNNKPHYKLQ